uniref:RT_RNaseH_2 domain-containing protein n=1 Tax=Strongyloides venezuelensis TaxID=75913 RepID=A0A0K0FX84_STRVS
MMQKAMSSIGVLRLPNFSLPFWIYTDSSKEACSSVICEIYEEERNDQKMKVVYVVKYYSKKYTYTFKQKSINHLELVAIYSTLVGNESLLAFNEVIIVTDSRSAISFIHKRHTDAIAKLIVSIASFHVRLAYIETLRNTLAGYLSKPDNLDNLDTLDILSIQLEEEDLNYNCQGNAILLQRERFMEEQGKDEEIKEIFSNLNENPSEFINAFLVLNGLLYKKVVCSRIKGKKEFFDYL